MRHLYSPEYHGTFLRSGGWPLAISIPDTPVKGKIIDSLVSQVDILPTILDYLQIPIPDECQGKSLRPVIEGQVEAVNEFVFVEYTGGAAPNSYAIRSARYKYYKMAGSEPFTYDLAKDPDEQDKIHPDDFPADVYELKKHLENWYLNTLYSRQVN